MSRLFSPRVVLAVLVAVALLTGARAERLGDRYQVVLPLLGLGCAAASGGAPDYALRYVVAWSGMRLGKTTLGGNEFALRPSGKSDGMPSGHTTSAVFGASALVRACLSASPMAQTAAVVAAGFTGVSRVEAGAHTIWQVLAGAIWALICERALRGGGLPALRSLARWARSAAAQGQRRVALRLGPALRRPRLTR